MAQYMDHMDKGNAQRKQVLSFYTNLSSLS